MMYKSQKSIMDQGIPELPKGSVKVCELPDQEVQVGNTSGIGLLSLPEDHETIIDQINLSQIFGESSDESFKGFDEVEKWLNSIIEENNSNKKQGNKKDITGRN